jgi:hypothetical protein
MALAVGAWTVRPAAAAPGCILFGEDSATGAAGQRSDQLRGQIPCKEAAVGFDVVLGIIVPVMIVCVFAFASIVFWTQARRKEREALYHSEALKKVADTAAPGATVALEMMREHERIERRKRREARNLVGILCAASGLGLMMFLRVIERREPIFVIGMIPFLVGLALLVFGPLVAGGKE